MEIKLNIPFHQLLMLVKSLTPSQKAKLKQELSISEDEKKNDKSDYIEMLLNGPVYGEKDIETIKENTKSISTWRTKR